ncbi:hypothetical protein [Bartonella sp. cb54]|uniref:hypothetical protein n=1 Tax=Bartonella sp. cb54 TaxID=3385560 RepID=UPI0039A64972
MINFNGGLKYWLTYIIGFAAILAIIIVGSFYMAKPYLDNFVKREIARRSIKAETSEVSIMGKINMTNVTVPSPSGMSLKIGAVSARPPISFIPGTFTLYNVDLKQDNIHVRIPKISINSVFLKEKDTTIKPSLLQSIMRIDLASIIAPDILFSIENKHKLPTNLAIKDFELSDFKNGHIRSVGIKSMDFVEASVKDGKSVRLVAKSDALKIRDIDFYYAHYMTFGGNNTINKEKTLIGPISLNGMVINVFEETEKNPYASLSLGKFKMSALKVRPPEQAPEKLARDYLNAKKANNQIAETAARNAILINSVPLMISANIQLDKAAIDAPQLKATFDSLQYKVSQWTQPEEQPVLKELLVFLDNFSLVPKKIEKESFNVFNNMDFNSVNFSGKIDISYDEKKRTLFLNTISLDVKDIGSGRISAKVVNLDKKIFSGQKDAIGAAVQDIGITEIDMRYTDAGFIDKFFSSLAQNFNDSDHDLKKELYDHFSLMMMQSIKILLKDYEDAENISKSFGDFAKNPQTLMIKVTAKDKKGLTVDDFVTILQNDLSAALSKVNLTVKTAL